MQVQPEPTPNPNAIKFTLDRPATEGGSETFKEGSDPAASPLGAGIFALGGVVNVVTGFSEVVSMLVARHSARQLGGPAPRHVREE